MSLVRTLSLTVIFFARGLKGDKATQHIAVVPGVFDDRRRWIQGSHPPSGVNANHSLYRSKQILFTLLQPNIIMTRKTSHNAVALLSLLVLLEPSLAFTSAFRRTPISSPATELNLVPGQGNQLVAAYNAATCKKDDEEDDDSTPVAVTIQESPRTFVNKVFHLPSVRRHPYPKAEGLDTHHGESDVVYYPMIGFTFCRNGDRVIALPTKSNVSCRLPCRDEEVYGWFSPVCKLDLYSDDPCRNPNDNRN